MTKSKLAEEYEQGGPSQQIILSHQTLRKPKSQ